MYNGWQAEAIDVEAAFLNADVDENIYIEHPQGLIGVDSVIHVCKLVKATMYGIAQAPRCWSKTFAKCVTNKPGMTKSKIDPMLFMHRNKERQTDGLLVNNVDDGIICETLSAVEYMKKVIKEEDIADIMTKNVKEQIHTRLSKPVQSGTMLQPLEHGNGEDVKNISPSHKDCGLDCDRTSRILHCHVN